MTAIALKERFSTVPNFWGSAMLLRMAGRLECPDTLTAKMPVAWMTPQLASSWPGGGCTPQRTQSHWLSRSK